MSPAIFEERLRTRARAINLDIDPRLIEPLERFYRLLVRWNERMNLTALPLADLPDTTVDRLFMEPLAAAPLLLDLPGSAWFDIGSGSGSPAIPLALARPDLQLTMVESKARKASFLREAARALALDATVADRRFDEVASQYPQAAALITVRGVRIDEPLIAAMETTAQPEALIGYFASAVEDAAAQQFGLPVISRLTSVASLHSYRVSRGTMR